MYLSKLVLNPRNYAARRDLGNPYDMHASLCRAFALPEETPPRFLWRLEPLQKRQHPVVLVQSNDEPNWQGLTQSEKFVNYFSEPVELKTVPIEHLVVDQHLRFRLRVNPTVTKTDPSNPSKRKRFGLYKLEDLIGYEDEVGEWHKGWLERQAAKHGFHLLSHTVAESNRLRFSKHKGGAAITLQAVRYEGHLQITDLDVFKTVLTKGIGKAKALGFGLLSIAKSGYG